jgi:hypothetical protein
VLDIFVDGANVTARVRETHGAFVLRDLALALIELSDRPRAKATVRFYDEPWELCVERFGAMASLSVYRAGADPVIVVYDRAVPFEDVVGAARDAIAKLLETSGAASGARLELASALNLLRATAPANPEDPGLLPEPVPVVVETDKDAPLSFGAEFALREGAPAGPDVFRSPAARRVEPVGGDAVERSDMHALLFRGRLRAEIRGRTVDLGDCHPVLVAERLAELARRAFDAWERGLSFSARGQAAGVLLGMRVSANGHLALTLGATQAGARRPIHTFPALGVADVLEASLAFGRAIVRAILRRDRTQSSNLRLGALRRALRESSDALRAATRTDSKLNPTPEPYRAFAAALQATEDTRATAIAEAALTRLRYAPRWRAIVPGLDLRATYLCGDRLLVGAATEMWALDRQSGRVLWRSDVQRGTSVVTPGGIARLAPDGTFAVYDFGTGERTLRARLAPRAGAPVAGAIVHLPGMPKLAIVTEGEHHLVAVDLTTGEPRWRWSWRSNRGAARTAPRMKRAGRLLFLACGDGALTALDVMTGAIVWRVRDRLRFRAPPTVARDALFVVAGGAHGLARLYCIDPFSGDVRWQRPLTDPTSPCTIEGTPMVAAGAVAVALRQKSGLALAAFRLEDGRPLGDRPKAPRFAIAPVGTSWLAVDDAFIGNTPLGELVAVDAKSAELRWRHVLGPRPLEADVPRRLEPVLRSGALFVPCSVVTPSQDAHNVHNARDASRRASRGLDSAPSDGGLPPSAGVCIVRPTDGALLGTIAPTDVIPDLLRVDERCDVYIVEESGHVAAFGALPRLSLVRPHS